MRLYAVVSMKGETRKTHMHRPLPSMEALSKSSVDDISVEVGNKFKQDKLATERRRMNRANYSIFDSSKTYDDFLSEAEDILDIDRYGISWGLGRAVLMCDGVFGMALQEEKISIKDNPFIGVDSISSLGQIDEGDSSKELADLT